MAARRNLVQQKGTGSTCIVCLTLFWLISCFIWFFLVLCLWHEALYKPRTMGPDSRENNKKNCDPRGRRIGNATACLQPKGPQFIECVHVMKKMRPKGPQVVKTLSFLHVQQPFFLVVARLPLRQPIFWQSSSLAEPNSCQCSRACNGICCNLPVSSWNGAVASSFSRPRIFHTSSIWSCSWWPWQRRKVFSLQLWPLPLACCSWLQVFSSLPRHCLPFDLLCPSPFSIKHLKGLPSLPALQLHQSSQETLFLASHSQSLFLECCHSVAACLQELFLLPFAQLLQAPCKILLACHPAEPIEQNPELLELDAVAQFADLEVARLANLKALILSHDSQARQKLVILEGTAVASAAPAAHSRCSAPGIANPAQAACSKPKGSSLDSPWPCL